jgi:hypothetical protein
MFFSGLFSFFVTNFITRGKIIETFSLYTCSKKKVGMITHLQQVGKINRKRFVITEETVLDILKLRLKVEKDVSVRRYILRKISLFK